MFKSLGKAFKKLFTKATDPNATKFATPVVKEMKPLKSEPMFKGSNGLMTSYEFSNHLRVIKKITNRRAKNKLARLSRNAQHRKAA